MAHRMKDKLLGHCLLNLLVALAARAISVQVIAPAISVEAAMTMISMQAVEDVVVVESGRVISLQGGGCGAVLLSWLNAQS
jgi:hypothetical protein